MKRVRLLAVLMIVFLGGTALAQSDRRDRQNPELIVESGGRLGSCDSLQFTSDGKFALAVGDDKVVRIWPYRDGKLQMDGMQVLRWNIWREQRGAIFALALSPDAENKYVAIAGIGPQTSSVAVLERATGKMVHQVVAKPPGGQPSNAIWSIAYAPDGKRVAFGDSFGGVWLWDFGRKAERIGGHDPPSKKNIVRFVHFFNNDTIVSIAENATLKRWDFTANGFQLGKSGEFKTDGRDIFRVAISPDATWYAAAAQGKGAGIVVLRSIDGMQSFSIELKNREFARAVAFDKNTKRLAITIATRLDTPFYMEDQDRVVFYDVNDTKTQKPGPSNLYRAWFIAFHPNGKDMAIAAGENHEVTLWRLDDMHQPVSVMGGVGKSMWDVALSKDNSQIGFRDQRKPGATDPNDRAMGPWRVFNLGRREWTNPADFKPVMQIRSWMGWTVKPDTKDPYLWNAVAPGGNELPLRLSPDKQDGMPLCYTFIPPTDKQLLRLAVGHLWGLSIYELTDDKAKRVRLCTGHQADVMALAASADGSLLVSASRDQTIAGWNLTNQWASQPSFGASFEIKGDKLFVKKVDIASPAWEAGLVAGDEVTEFHFDGDKDPLAGGAPAWLKRLQDPVPGKEHGFVLLRDGKIQKLVSTIRQRPLWRFFPTRDNEWVLWMWQNSYYDTSTKGDSYIGWHVNAPDMSHEPTFYRAEQFRKIYERPDVLDKLLQTNDVPAALREAMGDNPLPPRFSATEPPLAGLELAVKRTQNADVIATLTARPHGDNPDFQPVRAELWINDFRLIEDKQPGQWDKAGGMFQKKVTIPNAKLRAGKNTLTFQVYNRAGGRAEAAETLECTRPAPPPRLFGLAVGVNNYGNVKTDANGRGKLVNLISARNDAAAIQKSWQAQKTLYKKTDMLLELDQQASHDDILAALDRLAKQVGPEDRFVLFLAGHGLFVEHRATKELPPRTTWLFCCPDYDVKRPEETCITSEVLYAKLAAIAGRKLVFLDACHSGEAAANPVRSLVPGSQGPIVIASCDRNQSSYEDPKIKKHGLFTYALLEALGDKFETASKGKPDLDARQLYLYARGRMPELLREINVKEFAQVPILFAPAGDYFPVAKAKE